MFLGMRPQVLVITIYGSGQCLVSDHTGASRDEHLTESREGMVPVLLWEFFIPIWSQPHSFQSSFSNSLISHLKELLGFYFPYQIQYLSLTTL